MVWYNYLFYDTSISVEGTISTNFGLPLPPGKITPRTSKWSIKVNSIIYGLAMKVYSSEPNSLEKLDKELMRGRDLQLLLRALDSKVSEAELMDLDSKIDKLVQIRIQKFEIEGEVDPWISRIQKFISGSQGLEGEDKEGELKPALTEEEIAVTLQTEENAQNSPEFIDSESESEKEEADDQENLKYKPTLSKIDEERTDQLQPSIANDLGGEISPTFKSHIGSSATLRRIGVARNRNEPLNTAGTDARSHTDYITQDFAVKNYIQKTLMAGMGEKDRKKGVYLNSELRRASLEGPMFGSAELDMTPKKTKFQSPDMNHHSLTSMPKVVGMTLPLKEGESRPKKKLVSQTPTMAKRNMAPKDYKIDEEDCSLSSDDNPPPKDTNEPEHEPKIDS
jgi:hypothetical protein